MKKLFTAVLLLTSYAFADSTNAIPVQKVLTYRLNRTSFSALNNGIMPAERYTNLNRQIGTALGVLRWGASFPAVFVQGADTTSSACPGTANTVVIAAVDLPPAGVERGDVINCGSGSYVLRMYLQTNNQEKYVWASPLACTGTDAVAAQASNDSFIDMGSLLLRLVMKGMYNVNAPTPDCLTGPHSTITQQNRTFAQSKNQLCTSEITALADVFNGYYAGAETIQNVSVLRLLNSSQPGFEFTPYYGTTSPTPNGGLISGFTASGAFSFVPSTATTLPGIGGLSRFVIERAEYSYSGFGSHNEFYVGSKIGVVGHQVSAGSASAPNPQYIPPSDAASVRKAAGAMEYWRGPGYTANSMAIAAVRSADDIIRVYILNGAGTVLSSGTLMQRSVRNPTGAMVPARTRMPISIQSSSAPNHYVITYVDRDASERLCTDTGAMTSGYGVQNLVRSSTAGTSGNSSGTTNGNEIPLDRYSAETPPATVRMAHTVTSFQFSPAKCTNLPAISSFFSMYFSGRSLDDLSNYNHSPGPTNLRHYKFAAYNMQMDGCDAAYPKARVVGMMPIASGTTNDKSREFPYQATTYLPVSAHNAGYSTPPPPFTQQAYTWIGYVTPDNKYSITTQTQSPNGATLGIDLQGYEVPQIFNTANYRLYYTPQLTNTVWYNWLFFGNTYNIYTHKASINLF